MSQLSTVHRPHLTGQVGVHSEPTAATRKCSRQALNSDLNRTYWVTRLICYLSTPPSHPVCVSWLLSLGRIECMRCRLLLPMMAVSVRQFVTRLGGRVVSVPDSGSEEHGFESQSRSCRVAFLGKLFTPIVPRSTRPCISRSGEVKFHKLLYTYLYLTFHCTKTAERINILFGVNTLAGPRNIVHVRRGFDATFAKLLWPLVLD